MKKKEIPFYPYYLKPTKLKIIYSVLNFLVLFLFGIGTCMTLKSIGYCLSAFITEYYVVIIGLALISYFFSAWELDARASLISHWKFKSKIYWIAISLILLLILYLVIAYMFGFWPFCKFVYISGRGLTNTCSGLTFPM